MKKDVSVRQSRNEVKISNTMKVLIRPLIWIWLLYLCYSIDISSFKGFSDGLGQFSLICIGVTDKICNPEKRLQWGEERLRLGGEKQKLELVRQSQDLGNQPSLVYVFLFIFWHKALLILSRARCRDNGWQDPGSAILCRITLRSAPVTWAVTRHSAGWLSAPRRHPSSAWKLIVFHYSLMPQYLQLSQTMTKSPKQTER